MHSVSFNVRGCQKFNLCVRCPSIWVVVHGVVSFLQAPEVFKGLPYNEKADVFSFAICLYEVLHLQLLLAVITRDVPSGAAAEQAVIDYATSTGAGYRWVGC